VVCFESDVTPFCPLRILCLKCLLVLQHCFLWAVHLTWPTCFLGSLPSGRRPMQMADCNAPPNFPDSILPLIVLVFFFSFPSFRVLPSPSPLTGRDRLVRGTHFNRCCFLFCKYYFLNEMPPVSGSFSSACVLISPPDSQPSASSVRLTLFVSLELRQRFALLSASNWKPSLWSFGISLSFHWRF